MSKPKYLIKLKDGRIGIGESHVGEVRSLYTFYPVDGGTYQKVAVSDDEIQTKVFVERVFDLIEYMDGLFQPSKKG